MKKIFMVCPYPSPDYQDGRTHKNLPVNLRLVSDFGTKTIPAHSENLIEKFDSSKDLANQSIRTINYPESYHIYFNRFGNHYLTWKFGNKQEFRSVVKMITESLY